MTQSDSLKKYHKKRHFKKTPEPSGKKGKSGGKQPQFVIQKHDASTLHYDFRLEAEGVLKSWAVPKGPSTNPRDKRLAMPTEDHPLEYADFEGVIPEGEYGAGTVMVWDTGPYRNLRDKKDEPASMGESIRDGHVEIWLEGKKLQGGYALHRTATGKNERWILIKMKDEKADARRNPVSTEPRSVKSNRTLQQITQEGNS